MHGGKGLGDRLSFAHFAIAASRAGDHYKGAEKYSLPNQDAMDAGGLKTYNLQSDNWLKFEVLTADDRLLIPSTVAALQIANGLRQIDGIAELLPPELSASRRLASTESFDSQEALRRPTSSSQPIC